MGRYATISGLFGEEADVKCSGQLAQAIHFVIGEERFEEWSIVLTYQEVADVLYEFNDLIDYPLQLSLQEISTRQLCLFKLGKLLEWVKDNVNTQDRTLQFA